MKITESRINRAINESINKIILSENSYIWDIINDECPYVQWLDVDDDIFLHDGTFFINMKIFDSIQDYQEIELPDKYETVDDCLEFIGKLTLSDIYKLIAKNTNYSYKEISNELDKVAFEIVCEDNVGVMTLAETRPYLPED